MSKVLAFVSVTIREALRQKLAMNLLVFALILLAASFTLSTRPATLRPSRSCWMIASLSAYVSFWP